MRERNQRWFALPIANTIKSRIRALRSSRRCRATRPERRSIMLFFVWYDDTPKKLVVDKIQEAIAAYMTRFTTQPSLVLVNVVDYTEMTDVVVRAERTVQPNTFWVGHGDEVE